MQLQPGPEQSLCSCSSLLEVVRWTSAWLIVQHDKKMQPGNAKKFSTMDACFFWGGGCSMDDSGSGLATAMVSFLFANTALGDCFFWGWSCLMDDSVSGLTAEMVAFPVANPALDYCFSWAGGCSMDDSGSELARSMVTFLVTNLTMDVCFFWGEGCSMDDVWDVHFLQAQWQPTWPHMEISHSHCFGCGAACCWPTKWTKAHRKFISPLLIK